MRSLRSLRLSFQAGTKLPLGGWGVGHLRKIHEPHRILFQNFVYLCCILPRQCFPIRGRADGWDDIYEEGVYLTLCFPAYRNFATFRNRWEQVSGRCLRGYVIHRIDREASCPKEGRVRLVGHYISAWASALLVQTVSGNAKASMCGTSNRYRLPRFLFYMCTCPKVTDFCPAWGV